jgi:hypothetical protein
VVKKLIGLLFLQFNSVAFYNLFIGIYIMSLVNAAVYDNGIVRHPQPGDLFMNDEAITVLTNAASQVLTGAQLATGILSRLGPTAGYGDTFPDANSLVSSLISNMFVGSASGLGNLVGVQPNSAFRFRYINGVAFAATPVAGVGVTLGANSVVAASSVKEYLITVTNGTPAAIRVGNTTNANAVLSGFAPDSLGGITAGMLVTGAGIPAATTVLGVSQAANTVTLSANATATAAGISLSFSPTYRVDSLGQMLL